MATGSILLGIALLILVGVFIARPFLRPQGETQELTEYQLLLEEKEHLLDQIHALDFDHDTGKIPKEVHEIQRARLVEEAAAVLKDIDQFEGVAIQETPAADETVADVDIDADIEIEAAIARLRRQRVAKAKPASSVPAATPAPANGHARFCPQCGTPTDTGDRFCAHCGHNLTLTSSTKTA